MTIAEKKEYLRNYRRFGKEIDRKIEEYERLYSWIMKTTPTFSDMPKGKGNGDKLPGGIERLIETNEQLNADIDRYIGQRRKIASSIEALSDVTLRTVMAMYYLNGKTWEDVANSLGYDVRHIYRLHGIALEKINMSWNVTKNL